MTHDEHQADSQSTDLLREVLLGLAHDLRTPVAALIHQAEVLLDSDLDDKLRRSSELILESASQLSVLVDDVGDVEGYLRTGADDHVRVLAVAELLEPIELEGVTTETGSDAMVRADPGVVRRVIREIATSICRWAPGGDVVLSVRERPDAVGVLVTCEVTRGRARDIPAPNLAGLGLRLPLLLLGLQEVEVESDTDDPVLEFRLWLPRAG